MLTNKKHTIITIGTFDGVHIGHQNILKRLVELANEKKLTATVLTLFPHPRMVLFNDDSIKLLNTIDERMELLKHFGIQNVVTKTFTKTFANLSAEDYVKSILVDELNANTIIIGYDHHFGKGRMANIYDLKQFAEIYDFEVEEISAQHIDEVTVSSTKIRNAINNGQVSFANSFLGYNYFITGKVSKGKGLGKTINFPTANIVISEHYKLIPKDGVYAVKATIENKTIFGMMNIGNNPTVGGTDQSIEVHFFDFNSNLYYKTIRVEFLKRLRSEQKFENIEALKTQLETDKIEALQFINSQK